MPMTLFVAGVLIALVVSALCSLMEATLLSLTPAQVASIAERRPRLGRIWRGFKTDVERPIAVILLLNTTAHTIGAAIAGAQFGKVFGEEHLWLFALVFTFVMLQFTEILAKSLGVRFNRMLALIIARPLRWSTLALGPVLWLIHLINRPFEGRGKEPDESPATIEEIAALAGLARLSRQIGPQQERIIRQTPRLSEFRMRDIRIPIEEVAWLDSSQSLEAGVRQARLQPHTRFPVCDGGDIDRVVGYVNLKEMLLLATKSPQDAPKELPVRKILTVLEDDTAADVMSTFVRERMHIAIIQDAAGKTTGLVTLEDVVEELLGDIRDEFDGLPHFLQPAGDGRWLAGGGIRMQALSRELEVEIPAPADQPLSVWLEERIDGPFQIGSTSEVCGLRFTVGRLRRGSLHECTIRRLDGEPDSDPGTLRT